MSTISKVMSSSESDAGMSQRMVWVDLEMTGLDIERDQIIEMACIITDSDLNILAEGPNLIINQSSELLDRMSDWCKEHHGQSGLTQAVRDSKVSLLQAEYEFLSFIRQHTPPGHCPLAGNSVHADKKFLDKYMPQFMHHLHYRIIDVSTIKELCSCLHNIQVVEFVPKDLYGGFLKNTCLHHRRKHLTAHEDGAMSGQVECAESPGGNEMSTPYASTAPRSRDLSTPRSRHAARSHARDGYRSRSSSSSSSGSSIRSWHSEFSRHTFRSRHNARSREAPSPQARSRHDARSREAPSPQARSRHEDPSPQARSRHDARSREAPSPQARSRHDARSRHSDLSSPPALRKKPMFQKKVLSLLVDIRHFLKETQPASSAVHIED
ncbi:small fragment nuclease isoform X2 [Hypomesus transpacificus]|uniref:small fragment nuclease isoform X2 n=1 Tax=Hypomesus transpacificus TaxID=137520 RepID=UPI001F072179|nr:small fragment nuclease isoform X2 [Hypomesus transpacificus]